jgi:hypothetical protein
MIRMISAAVLVSLVSCARSQSTSAPAERSSPAVASTPAITLERTACFGGCTVYTIAVFPAGEVQYEGRANVHKIGVASGKVAAQQVDGLLSELEQGGYFTFADRYTSPEPACGRYATDSPSAISSVTLRGRTKRIVHDYGCGGAPGALVVLERRIDEALNSGQWTGR